MGDDGFDPYEWHVGDPEDWADGPAGVPDIPYMGYLQDDDDSRDSEGNRFSQREEYSKKAWECYMDYNEEEALHYINLALDVDASHWNDWNRKAIILEALGRYEESEECYDKSLRMLRRFVVLDNKARMLYAWAGHLLEESKNSPDVLDKLEQALEKIEKAIDTLPGDNSEENIDDYIRQRDSINFYSNYEKEYERNLETLKAYPKGELFTIVGGRFYGDSSLTPGIPLKLVKEPDNVHDKDAIAVYAHDEKIGYVANSISTKSKFTSSASELKDKIEDVTMGEYMFYLARYGDVQFPIGRIIR